MYIMSIFDTTKILHFSIDIAFQLVYNKLLLEFIETNCKIQIQFDTQKSEFFC